MSIAATIEVNHLNLRPGMVVHVMGGGWLRVVALDHEWVDMRTGKLVRNFRTECVALDVDSLAQFDAQVRGWFERGEYALQGNDYVVQRVTPESC